jgi:hypothetical protein
MDIGKEKGSHFFAVCKCGNVVTYSTGAGLVQGHSVWGRQVGGLRCRELLSRGQALWLALLANQTHLYKFSPTELGGNAENVVNAVASLQAMISRLMSRTIDEEMIHDCERHIHIFLSYFSVFDSDLRGAEKLTWVRSYNFMSLLNLPEVLRKYGSLRNLWEGGGQGERVLSIVKPTWGGYRKNWMATMLDRMLRQMAIKRIAMKPTTKQTMDVAAGVEQANGNSEGEGNDDCYDMPADGNDDGSAAEADQGAQPTQNYGRNYVNYRSIEIVRRVFKERMPLSVLKLRTGRFVCVIQKMTLVQVIPHIRIHREDEDDSNPSCNFFCWKLSEDLHNTSSNSEMDITNYCMLLPKLDGLGKPTLYAQDDGEHDECQVNLYTVIDSDWNVLHHRQHDDDPWTMHLPTIHGANYNTTR